MLALPFAARRRLCDAAGAGGVGRGLCTENSDEADLEIPTRAGSLRGRSVL
jgi:hypothetical protein